MKKFNVTELSKVPLSTKHKVIASFVQVRLRSATPIRTVSPSANRA